MNRLRQWASEGPFRGVLLDPRVRPTVASLLALRFLLGSLALSRPIGFLADWMRDGPRRSYALRRGGSVNIAPRADLEALYEVFWRHDYEPPAAISHRVGRPKVIADLGANVGVFSAFTACRWPGARIVAYEPDPDNACAYRSWAAGARQEVDYHEAVATVADGMLKFRAGLGGGSMAARDGEASIAVSARDVFPDLATADFVKMDIEGGEWPLLDDPRMADLSGLVLVMEYHRVGAPSLPARDAAEGLLHKAGFATGYGSSNYWGHGILWAWK